MSGKWQAERETGRQSVASRTVAGQGETAGSAHRSLTVARLLSLEKARPIRPLTQEPSVTSCLLRMHDNCPACLSWVLLPDHRRNFDSANMTPGLFTHSRTASTSSPCLSHQAATPQTCSSTRTYWYVNRCSVQCNAAPTVTDKHIQSSIKRPGLRMTAQSRSRLLFSVACHALIAVAFTVRAAGRPDRPDRPDRPMVGTAIHANRPTGAGKPNPSIESERAGTVSAGYCLVEDTPRCSTLGPKYCPAPGMSKANGITHLRPTEHACMLTEQLYTE